MSLGNAMNRYIIHSDIENIIMKLDVNDKIYGESDSVTMMSSHAIFLFVHEASVFHLIFKQISCLRIQNTR